MREIDPSAPNAQTGAVNVMWLVVILILWIATMGAFYFQTSEIASIQEDRTRALEERASWEERHDALFNERLQLAEVLGYSNAERTGTIDLPSLQADIESSKAALGAALGGPETAVTLEQSLKGALAALNAARSAQAKAEADFKAESSARRSADTATNTVRSQMQQQIDALQSDLLAEQQRAATTAQNDKRRHDELIAQSTDADEAARAAEDRLRELEAAAAKERALAEATIKALEPRRQPPEPDQPDGTILAVSDDGSVAWIDIGGKHGLRLGTRFDLLRRGRSGVLENRGVVEVMEIESDMAMVGIQGKVDPFDPVLTGDLVRNPMFDKNAKLNFAFLGEFPATMSREFVTGRLKELGADVSAEVSTSTDVLVLGERSLADEDAADLTTSDDYQLADKLGIRIIRLADLSRFLRY